MREATIEVEVCGIVYIDVPDYIEDDDELRRWVQDHFNADAVDTGDVYDVTVDISDSYLS